MSGDIFFIFIIWRVFHHQAFGTFGLCNCLWGMRRWVIWGFETFPELDWFWIGVVVYCFAYPQNQLVKRFWFVCVHMVACSTDNLKTKSMCTLCKQKNTYWYTNYFLLYKNLWRKKTCYMLLPIARKVSLSNTHNIQPAGFSYP